jgi:hypothetical protein
LYAHKNNSKKQLAEEKKKKTAQIGTNIRSRVFNAGLLARSQFASSQLEQGFLWFSLVPE